MDSTAGFGFWDLLSKALAGLTFLLGLIVLFGTAIVVLVMIGFMMLGKLRKTPGWTS